MASSRADSSPAAGPVFATTRWSVVLQARGDSTGAHESLAALCEAYWYPLYAFVRRQGHPPHDAQDLTQEFFARLIGDDWLARVDRERGKFRSFLLASLKHFLANEWDRARAAKRGGNVTLTSFDALTAEQRYAIEPADLASPERLFDRCWALQLLERVLGLLREEFAAAGKVPVFDALKPTLLGDATPQSEIAARLGASESAVKAATHRLRLRYRELLRAEIADTVPLAAEIDAELQHLFAALA